MTILIIVFMLVINAVLAAYEMALASISRTKISVLFQEKHAGAEAALFMKDHLEGSLAVTQIGMTLVGAIAAALGGAWAEESFTPFLQNSWGVQHHAAHILSIACVVLPLSFVTILFAELLPKTFALKKKEWVILTCSPYMHIIYKVLFPLVTVMEKLVRLFMRKAEKTTQTADSKTAKKIAFADLRTAAAIASSSRLFSQAEEKIVLASAQFCVRTIQEIQVPLEQVYFLSANDSIAETFLKAHLDMHTRFPVLENTQNPQSIIGYLNFKDIFSSTKTSGSAHTSTRSIVRPIAKLEDDTLISTALQQLMKTKQHICLVTDEGKITGILTLEDIFEELVGEIEDEYDFSPAYIRPFGESVLVSATAKMTDVCAAVQVTAPANLNPIQTVEQWVSEKLGRTPTKNEKLIADGLILETRKFRRHKLVEALVTKAAK
ncbi:MAG: HlyC/CorC family transporter [Elusimicrobiaceae bacterium]|nr:HlyC/CorC family transporter [Elusimicrobiaceae bacterium]